MKILLGIAALAAGLMSFSGNVRANTMQCDGCTDLQMQQIADENIYSLKMYGPLYLMDVVGGRVKKFAYFNNMTPEYNPENDPYYEWTTPVEVEPQVVQLALDLQSVTMQAYPSGSIQLPGEGLPQDAHEYLRRTDLHDDVENYIRNYRPEDLIQRFSDFLTNFEIPFFNPERIQLPLTVRFSDGSVIKLTYDRALRVWVYVPNSARDSKGNVIPETKEQIDGQASGTGTREYYFGDVWQDPNAQDDLNDMLLRMSELGVPVTYASSGGSGGYYSMVCAGDVCTIYWHQY